MSVTTVVVWQESCSGKYRKLCVYIRNVLGTRPCIFFQKKKKPFEEQCESAWLAAGQNKITKNVDVPGNGKQTKLPSEARIRKRKKKTQSAKF